MEQIATDTFTFEKLRKGGFVYVDKTEILEKLANGKIGSQFFIARPRRFGKSLAVSTLQCLFEGRKDLFTGLAIENAWDWTKTWPVLHLDMGSCQVANVEGLWRKILDVLRSEAKRLGIELHGETVSGMFAHAIEDLAACSRERQMVLLVDEYDKPILGHLGKPDANDIRDALKEFYSVIKTCEGHQRFAFITGVSKFSKVSIFSDLNNLNEFSMDARFATLFGYTHGEVKANFPEALAELGAKHGYDADGTFAELVNWYDGYRFEESAEPVFNPVSVGKCLALQKFDPYWFETGTPSFLLKLIERDPLTEENIEVSQSAFSVYEPDAPELMSLFYQTGYLTIKGDRWDGGDHLYRLGFPNFEVSKAFNESLSREFSRLPAREHSSLLTQMVEALRNDDVNDMLDALSCFFANIPANITVKREKYYQSLFYAAFVLIGARTHAECRTNRGRVDAVVETPCGIYVFEFKLGECGRDGARPSPDDGRDGARPSPDDGRDGARPSPDGGRDGARPSPDDGRDGARPSPGGPTSVSAANQTIKQSNNQTITLAQQALAQIKEKGYAEKYLRQGKKVTFVGAAFDAEMRNLSDRAIEVAADQEPGLVNRFHSVQTGVA